MQFTKSLKEKISIQLNLDPQFIQELLNSNSSSEEINHYINIDLAHPQFIKKLFKKELSLFKTLQKDKSLSDAYLICFSIKETKQNFINTCLKPLIYPTFLYVMAWFLLMSLILFMIPSLVSQMPSLVFNFPRTIILLIFGIHIGLILLVLLIKLSFKKQYYHFLLQIKNNQFNQLLKIYISYFFLHSINEYLKRGDYLIDSIAYTRYHPNQFLGIIASSAYKQLKEGETLSQLNLPFDVNLLILLEMDHIAYSQEQFEHLIRLYQINLNRLFKSLKHFIQFVSYSLIAVVIILSYQIVLLPLKLIEDFI